MTEHREQRSEGCASIHGPRASLWAFDTDPHSHSATLQESTPQKEWGMRFCICSEDTGRGSVKQP